MKTGTPGKERKRHFTLTEVLVAMVFVLTVLPVAVRGVLIANRAGVAAERKRVAGQLADRLLTELVVTGDWTDCDPEGDLYKKGLKYRWRLNEEQWDEGDDEALRLITVEVSFLVQEHENFVKTSTLVVSEETEE